MIGTPRRTCRGRPIICPGPCNHRRQRRIEKNSAEKPHWHACSWFDVNEENDDDDDDDEEDDEKKIDSGKIGLPVRLDETATMTANVMLIDVALSQMAICLEKKEENTDPRPVSISCDSPKCPEVPEIKATDLCTERDREQNSNCPPNHCTKCHVKGSVPKSKGYWIPKKKLSNYAIYLLIFCLYVLVHMFIAVLATRVSLYETFLSSQIVGMAALLLWRTTGTIPL